MKQTIRKIGAAIFCLMLPAVIATGCWSDLDGINDNLNNDANDVVKIYNLRDRGPAGGWIFHIVDNGDGTFTYYEAAPEDYTEGGDEFFQWGGMELIWIYAVILQEQL